MLTFAGQFPMTFHLSAATAVRRTPDVIRKKMSPSKPCSDERQNGFKLFKTKIVLSLKAKYVDIHNKNVLNVLDSFKKCIQKKQ